MKTPAASKLVKVLVLLAMGALTLFLVACGRSASEPDSEIPAVIFEDDTPPAPVPPFVEVAADVGLDFVHHNGMDGRLYYSEMMGGGVALFDYDGDGDLDIYLLDGHPLGAGDQPSGPIGRLYRNGLTDLGRLEFIDVTAASGLEVSGYGMGVVAFDYDRDGWLDLYVTQTGPNRLLRNLGDGTFDEVASQAGVDIGSWSVPAVALDYDLDGWLDLFVGDYVDYSLATNKRCTDALGQPNYCGPLAYPPLADHLLRNRGDGSFEDISQSSGIASLKGRTLGAIAGDFDGDGLVDIYVANDGTANHLWSQNSVGGFDDRALLTGTGVNGQGIPEASMGVAAGDIDGDGDADLLLGHLTRETNTLLVNQGDGTFLDQSIRSSLGPASLASTTFGVSWLDFDNDGWLDALTANGAVKIIKQQAVAGDPHPLKQRNQLFRGRGDGTFEEVGLVGDPVWDLSEVSRGSAVGDLDNDGDSDVVILNNNGPARLLLNTLDDDDSWIGIEALAEGQSPPGTELRLQRADGRWLHRWIHLGTGYGSSDDPRVIFGLGTTSGAQQLVIRWPDGATEFWPAPQTGRYTRLERGTGRPWQRPAASED